MEKSMASVQTIPAGEISDIITIQIQDSRGKPRDLKRDITIDLRSSSATGRFDVNKAGLFDGSVSSLIIPEGSSTASFYYKDVVAGRPVITATIRSGYGRVRTGKYEVIITPHP